MTYGSSCVRGAPGGVMRMEQDDQGLVLWSPELGQSWGWLVGGGVAAVGAALISVEVLPLIAVTVGAAVGTLEGRRANQVNQLRVATPGPITVDRRVLEKDELRGILVVLDERHGCALHVDVGGDIRPIGFPVDAAWASEAAERVASLTGVSVATVWTRRPWLSLEAWTVVGIGWASALVLPFLAEGTTWTGSGLALAIASCMGTYGLARWLEHARTQRQLAQALTNGGGPEASNVRVTHDFERVRVTVSRDVAFGTVLSMLAVGVAAVAGVVSVGGGTVVWSERGVLVAICAVAVAALVWSTRERTRQVQIEIDVHALTVGGRRLLWEELDEVSVEPTSVRWRARGGRSGAVDRVALPASVVGTLRELVSHRLAQAQEPTSGLPPELVALLEALGDRGGSTRQ